MTFIWNWAALSILPVSALNATTAQDQLAAIHAAASDPNTDPTRANQLSQLYNRLTARLARK